MDLNECWVCRKPGKLKCDKCKFAFYCSRKCEEMDQFRHEAECQRVVNRSMCTGCGNCSSSLLRCSSCFLAFYCNKTCQASHWPQHKSCCKEFQEGVFKMTLERLICSDVLKANFNLPCYIGNQNAEDYLRLHQNEGKSTNQALRLLFARLGDIKDVVRTVVDLPTEFPGSLHFVLNDIGPHVSARNLLFLFCSTVEPVAEHLVQIWYSTMLTAQVLKHLLSKLKTLIATKRQDALEKMRHIVDISDDHWDKCLEIWKGWYKLALDTEAADKMMSIRIKRLLTEDDRRAAIIYSLSTPEEHQESLSDFLTKGLLLPLNSPQRRDALFPNCTTSCYNPLHSEQQGKYADISESNLRSVWRDILNPDDVMTYGVPSESHALVCWDYVAVKEAVGKKDDVLDMYLLYLTSVFSAFIDKISNGSITFRFIVDDFKNLDNHLQVDEVFDRISVSTLCDYYSYPLLLKQFGPRLNKINKFSVLISCHIAWRGMADVPGYIQKLGTEKQLTRIAEHKIKKGEVFAEIQDDLIVGATLEDYFDTTPLFLRWLASDAVVYSVEQNKLSLSKQLIKHPEIVAKKLGLNLRDYCCELNHVVPFQRECSPRLISAHTNSLRRYLEWTVDQSDEQPGN